MILVYHLHLIQHDENVALRDIFLGGVNHTKILQVPVFRAFISKYHKLLSLSGYENMKQIYVTFMETEIDIRSTF